MSFNHEDYFEWLYDRTFADDSYFKLADAMNQVQFTWSVDHDSNRAADGISMRRSYLFENGRARENYSWDPSECTFFEMFAALADKMGMLLDKDPHETALHLLRNVALDLYTDDRFRRFEVYQVLDYIMDREYDYDGGGGFFPLDEPSSDQRDSQLLYQMNQYIIEYGW